MADGAVSGQGDALPYQSLYRRFRPQRFAELRAQPHVTLALQHAVRDERIGHAYLFSGPRGTGKTSTARILAKALNCTAPIDGEPCGLCESCQSIAAGTSFDVHELDAASNNSVDSIRDLVARAALSTPGKWKVYIIDEVHMLSNAASNALLKTLEEPPSHVVFILATTDPQKLLSTIRSRTQHFEFHLFNEAELTELVSDIAKAASLQLPEHGIDAAVRHAKGSARDALTVLDRVAAAGLDDDDTDALHELVLALGTAPESVIEALDRVLASGRDPQQVTVELIDHLRAGFLVLARREAPQDNSALIDQHEIEIVRGLGLARCVRMMELLGAAIVDMREAPEPRITLEVALLRACHPEADTSLEAVLERLSALEARVRDGISPAQHAVLAPPPVVTQTPPRTPARASGVSERPSLGAFRKEQAPVLDTPEASIETTVEPEPAPAPAPEPAGPLPGRDDLVKAWGDHLLSALRPKVRAIYSVGRFVGVESSDAIFALPNQAHVLHADPLKGEVVASLSDYFKVKVGLRLIVDENAAMPAPVDDEVARRPRARSAPRSPAPAELEDFEQVVPLDEEDEADPGRRASNQGTGITWAEESLLKAFPGAEEVAP